MSIVLLIFVQGIVLLFYFIANGIPAQGFDVMNHPTAILLSLVATLPAHLLTILAAWFVVTRAGKKPFLPTLGWSWNGFGFWKCLATTIGLFVVCSLIIYLIGGDETQLDKILKSSRAAMLTAAFLAAFSAPIVEETVYRGVLYPAIRSRFGIPAAIVFVTTVFAAVHYLQYKENLGIVFAISFLSLVLTVIRAATKSLLPCFVIHTIFNGVQALWLVLVALFVKN